MKNKIISLCSLILYVSLMSAAINNFQQNIAAAKNQINAAKHTIAQMTMLTTNRTMGNSGTANQAKTQRLKKLKDMLQKEIAQGFAKATQAQKLAKNPSQHNEVATLYSQLEEIKKQAVGF